MRMYLRQQGAFWLAAGLATSAIAMGTATPAAARRLPHAYQAEASKGVAAPRWEYGQAAWQDEARELPRRVASRRQSQRLERRQAARADQANQARFVDRQAGSQSSLASEGQEAGYDQRYVADRRHSSSGSGGLSGGSGSGVVAEARRWLGTNPTNRRSLWCGTFMNFVLERTGHHGTGSDLARSFASVGQRVSGPQVGAIAVMARRGGGHVGVVSGVDGNGNPIIISGNHGRKVAETVYPRGRVYAYVLP